MTVGVLDGKVAIVTGSTSGIGKAIAQRFSSEGAAVVINSSKSVTAGEDLAATLPNAIYVQADVSDEPQAKSLVSRAIEQWGHLDVLVNNAGTTEVIAHTDLEAATLDVWKHIFGVNVFGTWLVSRAAVEALRLTHGSIINITSMAGIRPGGSSIPYAASKAALNHLTSLLAKALGPEIRVNGIAPGLVDTPWTADWDKVREKVQRVAPLRRSAQPEDIAPAAVMLATASYVTGEVLMVDGGLNLAI
jgi:ketoreductase RED2